MSSDWFRTAACNDPNIDPDIFFPKRGQSLNPEADKACNRCPAFASGECLEYAIENYVQGRWAKTSPRDRARIRREMKRAQAEADTPVKVEIKKKKTA